MPKLCNGNSNNNQSVNPRNSKAFCEGIKFRFESASNLLSSNPHISGSDDALAWARGWSFTNIRAGGTIDSSLAPCCAVPTTVIPDGSGGS